MNLYISSFGEKGNFISFEKVTNQFLICLDSPKQQRQFAQIGKMFQVKCDLDFELFSSEMIFYELFYQDSEGEFHPVPVKLSSSLYVRRFSILDNLSGRDEQDDLDSPDRVYKYTSTITLKFLLHGVRS